MSKTTITPAPTGTTAHCMNAIRNVVRALRIDSRAIEQEIGLSLAQLFVLQELDQRAAQSLSELAERTATHQSSVSVVVKRLVDRGLVSRVADSDDRRRVRLGVTPEGQEVLRRAPSTVQSQLIWALQRMDAARREELALLLNEWLSDAGVSTSVPPMFHEEASVPVQPDSAAA